MKYIVTLKFGESDTLNLGECHVAVAGRSIQIMEPPENDKMPRVWSGRAKEAVIDDFTVRFMAEFKIHYCGEAAGESLGCEVVLYRPE